jgi:SAM-dependent methyltransferase
VQFRKRTDWNLYYEKPFATARFSRRITETIIVRGARSFFRGRKQITIAELGGGNSCFYEGIAAAFEPARYHIIDNNEFALALFRKRSANGAVRLHLSDVRRLECALQVDFVFSTGLIEHFSPEGTEKAIEAHFDLLKPGGLAVITFPTPTFLYRLIRYAAERMGTWIFHDERPLAFGEVIRTVKKYAAVRSVRTIWPTVLTQGIVEAVKKEDH